jgi:hypothetical protein
MTFEKAEKSTFQPSQNVSEFGLRVGILKQNAKPGILESQDLR